MNNHDESSQIDYPDLLTISNQYLTRLERLVNNLEPINLTSRRNRQQLRLYPISLINNQRIKIKPIVLDNILLNSDQLWSPTVLVIGPGGMKGYLELGGLIRLEEEKILSSISTYIGVSVGSIICLLKIAGYTWPEIAKIGMDFNLFPDWNKLNLADVVNKHGLISHDKLRDVLNPALIEKYGIVPDFEQFYLFSGKNYISVSYNLSLQKPRYFSRYSDPSMSVVEGAIASASIPFVFQFYKYKGYTFVDGALGNPYPVNIVDDGQTDVLGLYVISEADDDNILSILSKLINAPLTELRQEFIGRTSHRCRHLELCCTFPILTGTNANNKQRNLMIKDGYQQAQSFVETLRDTIIVSPKSTEPVPYIINRQSTESSTSRLFNSNRRPTNQLDKFLTEQNKSVQIDQNLISSVIDKTLEATRELSPQPMAKDVNHESISDLNQIRQNIIHLLQDTSSDESRKRVINQAVSDIINRIAGEVITHWSNDNQSIIND